MDMDIWRHLGESGPNVPGRPCWIAKVKCGISTSGPWCFKVSLSGLSRDAFGYSGRRWGTRSSKWCEHHRRNQCGCTGSLGLLISFSGYRLEASFLDKVHASTRETGLLGVFYYAGPRHLGAKVNKALLELATCLKFAFQKEGLCAKLHAWALRLNWAIAGDYKC